MNYSVDQKLALLIYPHPLLKKECALVADEEFNTFELEVLCGKMLNIMRTFEGLGLAANQVGILKRIFVFENQAEDGLDRPENTIPDIFINPVIEDLEDTSSRYFKEGCLSFPGSYPKIKRKEGFILHYQTLSGEKKTLGPDICKGLFGQAFQHEIDHLDGKTMLDRTDSMERRKLVEKVNKLRKRK